MGEKVKQGDGLRGKNQEQGHLRNAPDDDLPEGLEHRKGPLDKNTGRAPVSPKSKE